MQQVRPDRLSRKPAMYSEGPAAQNGGYTVTSIPTGMEASQMTRFGSLSRKMDTRPRSKIWNRRECVNRSRPGLGVLFPSLALLRFLLSPAIGHCARPHCVRCSRASAYDLSALRQSLAQTSTLTIPDRVCVGDEHSLGYGGSPLPSSKSGQMWNRLCMF